MITVDARGKLCPQPLIMTRKAIKENKSNEALLIIVDNEASMKNVSRFLDDNGMSPIIARKNNLYEISVGKTVEIPENVDETEYCEIDVAIPKNEKIVISFQSDKMGNGADELGDILIKGFINTLPEMDNLPSALIFLNSGINLTCQDSSVLNSLKKMEEKGVKILSCGTCLDYYKKMDKLSVGSVSNMYDILDNLMNASKVIYP